MIRHPNITDFERAQFLQRLAEGSRGKDGLLLTPWEQEFVNNFTKAYRYYQWFTDSRRNSADDLRTKFGSESEIKMPMVLAEAPQLTTPIADPNGCEFIVRDEDRRLGPCNTEATKVNKRGFRYCDPHAEAVQKDLKRRGGHMELRTFTPRI